MKLISLLLFWGCLHLSAASYSQKVTLQVRNQPIVEVLEEIERKTELTVVYNDRFLDRSAKVSIQARDASLTEVLKSILSPIRLTYSIKENTIVISEIPDGAGPTVARQAVVQRPTVAGTVRDEQGKPVQGVIVTVKDTRAIVATDADGKYRIQVPADGTILTFSLLGYVTVEREIRQQSEINVSIQPSLDDLDEVVVIGYGTAQKSDLTGAVGQVNVKDMAKAPVANFAEALAGRVAGVQVSAADGQPGGGINIMIRGAGSLTQSTTPLYVVDGFPIEELDPSTLNTEDIESISILKDASSTAIYGSRAANGVVLIQTKRGSVGKPVASLGSKLGFQPRPDKIPLMSPYEFLKYQMELNPVHASTRPYFEEGETLDDYENVPGLDWQDVIFRVGAVRIYDGSVRGGTDHTKYSISGNIYNQDGAIINTGFDRYSGRVTVDQKITNKLSTGITANYTGVHGHGMVVNNSFNSSNASSAVLMRTWMYRPVLPLNSQANLEDEVDEDAIAAGDFRVNPSTDLKNQHQHAYTNLIDGNGYINYEIIKGLTFKTIAGIRHGLTRSEVFNNSKVPQGNPRSPTNISGINGTTRNTRISSWMNENILTYKGKLGKDHNMTAVGVFGVNEVNTNVQGFTGTFLPNEGLKMDGIDQGVTVSPQFSSSSASMMSYAGRFEYNYQSKYLVTLTYRSDGSSKFFDHWGHFPGAAVAWNIGNEQFFKRGLPFVSNSKIRLSYGSTGNNRVTDFAAHPSLIQNINGYSFRNASPTQAVYVASVGNMGLRWEKINTFDLGYELSLFKNRVSLEVDLYRKTTEDMLLFAPLPPSSGFSSAYKNIGRLENRGLEIALNTINFQQGDFRWSSSFNISFNRNKVLGLNEGQQAVYANGRYFSQFNKPLYISEIGKPAGMMMGFVWEGNYQYEHFDNPSPGVYILKNDVPSNGAVRSGIQPGDIRYRDMNGDGIVNDYDLAIIGRGQPVHYGGFSNNFGYKGFALNLFFQWSYGNNIYNANRLGLEGNSNGFPLMNQYATYVNRWSPENQTDEHYRTRGQGPIGYYSSKVVEDGSYLRLKTLSLDYSLPPGWIHSVKLNSLILSVAAQNLITWTNYSGLDPEVSILNSVTSPGFDFSGYPQVRTVTFGIKAGF